jgi:hypothetical protein
MGLLVCVEKREARLGRLIDGLWCADVVSAACGAVHCRKSLGCEVDAPVKRGGHGAAAASRGE